LSALPIALNSRTGKVCSQPSGIPPRTSASKCVFDNDYATSQRVRTEFRYYLSWFARESEPLFGFRSVNIPWRLVTAIGERCPPSTEPASVGTMLQKAGKPCCFGCAPCPQRRQSVTDVTDSLFMTYVYFESLFSYTC